MKSWAEPAPDSEYDHACRDHVPTFPQRSPPSLLTTAACGGLRSAPDCRPRRTSLHLPYSYAAPFGPAILVTQDPNSDIAASQNIGSRHSPSDGSDIPCGPADAARCQAAALHANADAASLCSSPSG